MLTPSSGPKHKDKVCRLTEGKEDACNLELPVHDYVKTHSPSAPILIVLAEKKRGVLKCMTPFPKKCEDFFMLCHL